MSSAARTRPSSSTPSSGGRSRFIAVLVGLAVVGFVAVVAVTSANDELGVPDITDIAGPVTIDGPPLPALPQEGSDPLTGQGVAAPVATVLDLEGNEVTIGAPGQAQVLVFLAHWCPVCQQEVPVLVDLIDAGGVPDGVELIAVLTGLDPSRPNWPPDVWLEREGYTGMIVRDAPGDQLMGAFGMRAYPAWAVIDAQGHIQTRRTGLLPLVGIAQLFDEATRG
jgi:cytochrome c biogenesis protein CcmG, thiol:disulfide interchange protein DsbE